MQTRAGTFLYRVRWVKVVQPDDFSIARQTTRPSLTLTTCYPRFSRKQRLVVRAVQVYGNVPGGFLDERREFSSLSP